MHHNREQSHSARHMPLTLLCMDLPGCAVSRGARVGLDIEDGSRGTRQRPLALARRHFSPTEIAALAGGAALTGSTICARTWQRPLQHTRGSSLPLAGIADEDEQRRHFLRLWTLKEAYVKALGRGVLARPGLQVLHRNAEYQSE